MWTTSSTTSRAIWPEATSAATQIARSNPEPILGTEAGERFTVTLRRGIGCTEFEAAALTRSGA